MEGEDIAWPEQALIDQDKARRVRNHVIWSAATVREKTYPKGDLAVKQERVTIYVEFMFPIKRSDMQILTEQRFECIKTTKEWKSKIRLWNGSEPIQQIHTRDPMSTATLLYYKEVGERCYSNQATSSSGIGTSGRRPLASDPHALCSSQNWMTRWNAFLGKTTLTTKKGRAESKTETVTMRVTEETRCDGCQECEVQYCSCQLGKDTTVATTMPAETPSHQDCLVQYCNCKQPWDEMLIEESDDAMNVCTMLISVSPCIDLEEETLGGHCWAVELDQEATQVLPRRSTRQR